MTATTDTTTTTKAVTAAEARLHELIERGADERTVEAAQRRLERARQQADDEARRRREREHLVGEVKRKKNREERAALQRKALEAEKDLRGSAMALQIDVRYAGGQLTGHFAPEASTDRMMRLTTAADLQRVLALITHDFERACGAVRARAMGANASEAPSTIDRLVANVKDVARRGIAAGTVQVCARHERER